MRKWTLFKVFLLLVLCVVGVGFYRGWFVLASQGDSESNKVGVSLTVDSDKAIDDAKAVETKARELTGSEVEESPSAPVENGVQQNDESPSAPVEDGVQQNDE